jgi:integrase
MRREQAGKPATGWVFPGGDPDGHVSYSTIDSQHGRTIEKLNAADAEGNKAKTPISPFRLYDCRHTFLTRLGEANTDPFTIQRIAGHSSIVVSQKYVHPTPERLEDAFLRLETYNEIKITEMKAKQKSHEAQATVN